MLRATEEGESIRKLPQKLGSRDFESDVSSYRSVHRPVPLLTL